MEFATKFDRGDTMKPNSDATIFLRSCRKETIEPMHANNVFGSVPTWLRGSLLKNGPGGPQIYGDRGFDGKHLLDSPGLLQKFEFCDGQIFYSNRFVQTKSHQRNTEAKRLVMSEFGTAATPDPCQTIFHRLAALFSFDTDDLLTDTANVSVYPFGDEIYALAETGFAHKIDVKSLETTHRVNLFNELAIIHHSSHPQVFEHHDKVYNIGLKLSIQNRPHYAIAEMDTKWKKSVKHRSPWSTAKIVAEIPSRWFLRVCYMHSFAMTENYFVVIEQPMSIFLPDVPVNLVTCSKPLVPFKFYPEEDTIFHVIPRDGRGKRKVFTSPSFFFMHTINAFETTEGNIVVDICCYNDPKLIEEMYIESLLNNMNYAQMLCARPVRFTLNLGTQLAETKGVATRQQIVDIGCELPTINNRVNSKEYNYFYSVTADIDSGHSGLVVKVNVQEKSFQSWGDADRQSFASEPIFVPTPGASDEDDGIILSTLLYGGEDYLGVNSTSVVILDAKKWELLAKVNFSPGTSVPKCLHGWFFPRTLDGEPQLETQPIKTNEKNPK